MNMILMISGNDDSVVGFFLRIVINLIKRLEGGQDRVLGYRRGGQKGKKPTGKEPFRE